MTKKFLAKIIAKDEKGLHLISAYCAGSKIKINDIKFLKSNKIFLLLRFFTSLMLLIKRFYEGAQQNHTFYLKNPIHCHTKLKFFPYFFPLH